MNFQFYLEKLKDSEGFKKFINENSSAYLCSGFFTIDKVGNDNKQHLDYYCPPAHPSLSRAKALEINNKLLIQKISEGNNLVVNSDFAKKSMEGDFEAEDDRAERGQIFSFQLENNCKLVLVEQVGGGEFERVSENIDFNFEEIERMIVERMVVEGVKNKLQKILLSLQNVKGKNVLIGTVFISGLGIIKVKIDLNEKKITEFEKKSFFEMVNIVRKK